MADAEITQEEVKGIDLTQVSSMQLNDGTVVMIQPEENVEEQYQEEGEFAQEEVQDNCGQEYDEQAEANYEEQTNQLRARPLVGRMVAPVVPRPIVHPKPVVMPVVRPPVRPVVVPRGPVPVRPVVPMGYGVPLRARPGMPVMKPVVAPRPVVPVVKPMPKPMVIAPKVPVHPVHPVHPVKPAVVVKPGVVVKPVVPVKPVPMVTPVVPGRVFRARPQVEEEQEGDFQEEEYAGEEEYCQCDEQAQGEENQLRARPMMVPVVPQPIGMRPKIVAPVVPRPVVPVVPRRGPVPRVPVVGYNTFQPRVFRARPRVVAPVPMFTPVTHMGPRMMKPMMHPPMMHPPMHHPMRPAVILRNRPRSNSYDAEQEQYVDECGNECQVNAEGTECNKTCVCSKCGKEF